MTGTCENGKGNIYDGKNRNDTLSEFVQLILPDEQNIITEKSAGNAVMNRIPDGFSSYPFLSVSVDIC